MENYNTKTCLVTFDVEEWFQVENLRAAVPRADWSKYSSSVLKNTEQILTLLQKQQSVGYLFYSGLGSRTATGNGQDYCPAGS